MARMLAEVRLMNSSRGQSSPHPETYTHLYISYYNKSTKLSFNQTNIHNTNWSGLTRARI